MKRSWGAMLDELLGIESVDRAERWLDNEAWQWVDQFGGTMGDARVLILRNMWALAGHYDQNSLIRLGQIFPGLKLLL
jgi:hypothetical protein